MAEQRKCMTIRYVNCWSLQLHVADSFYIAWVAWHVSTVANNFLLLDL